MMEILELVVKFSSLEVYNDKPQNHAWPRKEQSLTLKTCKSILKMIIVITVYLKLLKKFDSLLIYDLGSQSMPKCMPWQESVGHDVS